MARVADPARGPADAEVGRSTARVPLAGYLEHVQMKLKELTPKQDYVLRAAYYLHHKGFGNWQEYKSSTWDAQTRRVLQYWFRYRHEDILWLRRMLGFEPPRKTRSGHHSHSGARK